MKKLLAIITLFTLVIHLLGLSALANNIDYEYSVQNDGTIRIWKYTGKGGAVTIPDSINGMPVTTIGRTTFYENPQITSVTIPESIINIEPRAFLGCEKLTSIKFIGSVPDIGAEAFATCYELTSIIVEPTESTDGYSNVNDESGRMAAIGTNAFRYCLKLRDVSPLVGITSIGDNAFNGCIMESFTIPEGVVSIGKRAFSSCVFLHTIEVPDSVTFIGEEAFDLTNEVFDYTYLVGSSGTYAEQYAKENGLRYLIRDERVADSDCTNLTGTSWECVTPVQATLNFGENGVFEMFSDGETVTGEYQWVNSNVMVLTAFDEPALFVRDGNVLRSDDGTNKITFTCKVADQ